MIKLMKLSIPFKKRNLECPCFQLYTHMTSRKDILGLHIQHYSMKSAVGVNIHGREYLHPHLSHILLLFTAHIHVRSFAALRMTIPLLKP